MVDSAAQAILDKVPNEIWHRGETYADNGKVFIRSWDEKVIEATVTGTSSYHVSLRHAGNGFIRRCNCPYAGGASSKQRICKHLIAVALIWDDLLGFNRPTPQMVENLTIPPPKVSRQQINSLFADPLHADLELLRSYVDGGHWSRPHSSLPKAPRFDNESTCPIRISEIRQAFRTIQRWENRSLYDPYFCAGEMVAAFCEVLRIVQKRIPTTPVKTAADGLIIAQQFHRTLILELIDDSDGLHLFGEAHLENLFEAIMGQAVQGEQRDLVEKQLQIFASGRETY